jgi:hypothetical protein
MALWIIYASDVRRNSQAGFNWVWRSHKPSYREKTGTGLNVHCPMHFLFIQGPVTVHSVYFVTLC